LGSVKPKHVAEVLALLLLAGVSSAQNIDGTDTRANGTEPLFLEADGSGTDGLNTNLKSLGRGRGNPSVPAVTNVSAGDRSVSLVARIQAPTPCHRARYRLQTERPENSEPRTYLNVTTFKPNSTGVCPQVLSQLSYRFEAELNDSDRRGLTLEVLHDGRGVEVVRTSDKPERSLDEGSGLLEALISWIGHELLGQPRPETGQTEARPAETEATR
jgi:hypothetical protein